MSQKNCPNTCNLISSAAAATVCGLFAFSASSATLIATQDFESGGPAFPIVFDSGGGTLVTTAGVASAKGVGGSQGLFISADASNVAPDGNGFSYYGLGVGTNFALSSPATSTDRSLYALSLSAAQLGSNNATAPATVTLEFQDASAATLISLTSDEVQVGGTHTPFVFNLFSQFTLNSAGDFDSVVLSDIASVNLLFNATVAHNNFGFDDGNELRIDNIELTLIPEPASLGLLGAAGAMLVLRRRR